MYDVGHQRLGILHCLMPKSPTKNSLKFLSLISVPIPFGSNKSNVWVPTYLNIMNGGNSSNSSDYTDTKSVFAFVAHVFPFFQSKCVTPKARICHPSAHSSMGRGTPSIHKGSYFHPINLKNNLIRLKCLKRKRYHILCTIFSWR